MTEEELEQLAAKIALKTWQKIRRWVRQEQRELHDNFETEDY